MAFSTSSAGNRLRHCGDADASGITASDLLEARRLCGRSPPFAFAVLHGIIARLLPVHARGRRLCRRGMGPPRPLDSKPGKARLFYATTASPRSPARRSTSPSTRAGALLGRGCQRLLAAPLMAVMMQIVRNPNAMGRCVSNRTMILADGDGDHSLPRAVLAFLLSDWLGLRAPPAARTPLRTRSDEP